MKIKTYGTRGSTPICRKEASRYGGNTTCIRVFSDCLPEATALVVDAGSGLVPCSNDLLDEAVRRIVFLLTHYHHDHTQGLPLAPHTYIEDVLLEFFGPVETHVGPKEMMENIMRAPFFPVDFSQVSGHFRFNGLKDLGSEVLVIHPEAGVSMVSAGEFARIESNDVVFQPGGKPIAIDACLVVRVHRAHHPACTLSFRFEERPTNRVLVILTDHENTDRISQEFRKHVEGADLLVQDAQYLREQYETSTTGYGHGTGDYGTRIMKEIGVGRLCQTHHDPMADDSRVDAIVQEARNWLVAEGAPELVDRVFAAEDYQEIEV